MKFEIINIIWGGETDIKCLGRKLIKPAVSGFIDMDPEKPFTTEAEYSDELVYDHDLPVPPMKEGDSAYFITGTVFVKSNVQGVPDFQSEIKIVSLNSMTGDELNTNRDKYVSKLLKAING